MAVTYTVNEAREAREIAFSGDTDRLEATWSTSYRVYVDDAGDPTFRGEDVDPYSVVTATGLPIVNRSIYSFGGKVMPYVICRNKRATQDPKNGKLWNVTCRYRGVIPTNSSEADDVPINPPQSLSDISPRETPELGETEKVIYVDKSETPKRIQLPSGNWWSDPAIERVPILRIKITQYEESVTYEQLLDRHLKVNENTYRGQPRYDWLIEAIEPVEVNVTLASGTVTAALVTYTLALSPHLYGWKDDRALFDTVYLDGATWKPFLDGDPPVSRPATVTVTGTLKSNGTADEPDYVQYETFDTIDYSTFLQV